RDGDPLLLTAGEVCRTMRCAFGEPKRRQRAVGSAIGVADTCEAERHDEGLSCSQRIPEVVALKHERDCPRSGRRECGLAHAPERSAEYADITGRRFLEAGREMKERALPRARPAENRDEFAGLDAQVETSKRDCLDLSGAIDLEDVDALKCRPGTG